MRIYLVKGNTGEYADRAEWIAKAFNNEIAAIHYCDHLNKLGGWEHSSTYLNMDEQFRSLETLQEFDPKARMDYTGTYYEIESMEVEDGN